MKHLFVARHGSYGNDYRLDESGCKEIENLGRAINEVLNGSSAYIVSSTAPRALDSSRILAAQLDLPEFEEVQYLWTGNDSPPDSLFDDFYEISMEVCLDRLTKIVAERREKADGLVMVTHTEIGLYFPRHFIKEELGINEPMNGIPKGHAIHIDLEGKTYQFLPGK